MGENDDSIFFILTLVCLLKDLSFMEKEFLQMHT